MFYRVLLFYCFIAVLLCNAMEENKDIFHYKIQNEIYGLTFFDNKTILTVDAYNCSTICAETGEEKKIISLDQKIQDFSLSKKGALALVTSKLLDVYDVHTQKRLYCRDIAKGFYKIFFCSDNKRVMILDIYKNIIFVSTKNSCKQLSFPVLRDHCVIATHPINNDLFIANVAANKHTVLTIKKNNEYNVKKNIKNKNIIQSGEYNPNGTVAIMSDSKKYRFYKTDDYKEYLSKNKYSHEVEKAFAHYYASIAFHPTEPFMAFFDIRNLRIEFWNYIKRTRKPFSVIELEKTVCSFEHDFLKCMAFSPNGELLVVINKVNKKVYTIPIKAVMAKFKAEYVTPESIFAYWILNQFPVQSFNSFVPKDIIKLIINNIFLLSGNQFIAHKLRQQQQLKQQQQKRGTIKREDTKKK